MSDELKPCPFCGGPAEMNDYVDQAGVHVYVIKCLSMNCASRSDLHVDTDVCVAAWNTRPIEDELRAKWDAIPWGPIIACAGIASFQRGAPEAMTVLEWYKDNAPKEATK